MLVHAAGPAKATGCGRACELLLAARACAATKIASALPGTTRKPAILTPMNHGLHQNIGPPQQEKKQPKEEVPVCAAFQSSFLRTSFRSWLQLWTRITDTAHDTGSTKLKAHAPKPTFARTVVVNYNWVQTAFASDHNQHTRRRSLRSRVTHVAMAFPQESASRRSLLDV